MCLTGKCVFQGLRDTAAELPTMGILGLFLAAQMMAASQAYLQDYCILYDIKVFSCCAFKGFFDVTRQEFVGRGGAVVSILWGPTVSL